MSLVKLTSPDIEWKIHNIAKETLTEGKSSSSNIFEVIVENHATKYYFHVAIRESKLAFFLHMQEPKLTGYSTKLSIFIWTLNNEKEKKSHFEKDFSAFKGGWGWNNLISVSELLENSDKYLNDGTLRIGAKIKHTKSAPVVPVEASTAYCQHIAIFKHFFDTKIFSDITFICSDGIEIQAHRFALAAGSFALKKIVETVHTKIIEVFDIDSGTMIEILRYIYIQQVNNVDEYATKLIYGAEKYELDGLKKLCVTTMIKQLSIENAVDCFLLADQYDAKDLLDNCIEFIKEHHQKVAENVANWEKLGKKHLNMLLANFKKNPEYILILESSFLKTYQLS